MKSIMVLFAKNILVGWEKDYYGKTEYFVLFY